MTSLPPPAEVLRILDAELYRLDARRAQLLARRAWLVSVLQPVRPLPAPPSPSPRPGHPEATAPGVQNVLLLLGGVLLTVAAMVFTLVSWGHLGITGRSLVLAGVTLAVLGAPVALLRRGLDSTAESVAGLGLALTVLDAYALHEAAFATADGVTYTALASTVLMALWAAYGTALGGLRLPRPAALVAGQLPLPLWVLAADGGTYAVTAALLLTAAGDALVALRVSARPLRPVALVGAFAVGGCGVLASALLALDASGPGAAARAAALLLLAAAIALGVARRAPVTGLALGTATAAGLCLVTGAGGVLRMSLPGAWVVPACLACGVALLAAARGTAPVHRGLALASYVVQGGAVLWAVPAAGVALLGPAAWLARVWTGAPEDARAAVTVDAFWPPHAATAPLVLVVVAALLAVRGDARWRACALVPAWAAAIALPAALELPYAAGLTLLGLLVAALLGRGTPQAAGLAVATSLSLGLLSLAAEPATLTVLASLTALFAVAALRGRSGPVPAAASLGHATALACAVGASAGWRPEHIALLVLVVPATAALLAPRPADAATTLAVEITGAVAALVAVGLALPDLPLLALVLSLCAVIAAGTAVRPDRRRVGYAAVVLFVLAAWVRLAAWHVGVPEAYTLPATAPALLVGVLRRRRDREASSWTAYGPGLAATLVPSLAAAWGDPEWTRPLLLGAAALLVTLLGARHRLQSLLVLGGSVLVLDALHELAPYLVQAADALPRWVPPALAGLLLLALGATYERRLRNVRKVREVLGRMN
ncbi:hypothetical protein U5640_36985 [Streptomyces sp. SS7]|uniref:SCO7613 C-terminal domain-containing membrane protein n=1 Tax=Streptomyces sp. SS7 TaxID=3108485 RepID=UPI0030EE825D